MVFLDLKIHDLVSLNPKKLTGKHPSRIPTDAKIFVITKILKNKYEVRDNDSFFNIACKFVNKIDTNHCNTISFSMYKNSATGSSEESLEIASHGVILGNMIMKNVGIGWIYDRRITFSDIKHKLYPIVVDDDVHRALTIGKKYGI